MVAKEFGYEIREWIVPVDVNFSRNQKQDGDDESTYTESQHDKFTQFLFRSSRYVSVFDNQRKRLLVVEDFPNIFINDPETFNEILG